MGLSFNDEESMIESIAESLRFAPKQPNLNSSTVTGDDDGIQGGNDAASILLVGDGSENIEMVDRWSVIMQVIKMVNG